MQTSLQLLQKAKLLTGRDQPFLGNARLQARALTLNNLGCLMRKWGKPRVGISLLARALRIEANIPGGAENPSGTHLNMSAALSSVGMHREAAAHAGHAIFLASQAMEQANLGKITTPSVRSDFASEVDVDHAASAGSTSDDKDDRKTGSQDYRSSETRGLGEEHGVNDESVVVHDGRSEEEAFTTESSQDATSSQGDSGGIRMAMPSKEDLTQSQQLLDTSEGSRESVIGSDADKSAAGGLLAIAYYNFAVEREHLGQHESALEAYENARRAAGVHLGPDSPVAKGIELALQAASAAACDTATANRRRRDAQPGVSSFPAIGKLTFSPRTHITDGDGLARLRGKLVASGGEVSDGGERLCPDGAKGIGVCRSRLARAYTTARPYPPRRPAAFAWAPRLVSGQPHHEQKHHASQREQVEHSCEEMCYSPSGYVGGGRIGGGPERAGRWTAVGTSPRAVKTPRRSERSEGLSQTDDKSEGGSDLLLHSNDGHEGLLWRAQVCAQMGLSPRDARRAQLEAERTSIACREGEGDSQETPSQSPRWVEADSTS